MYVLCSSILHCNFIVVLTDVFACFLGKLDENIARPFVCWFVRSLAGSLVHSLFFSKNAQL